MPTQSFTAAAGAIVLFNAPIVMDYDSQKLSMPLMLSEADKPVLQDRAGCHDQVIEIQDKNGLYIVDVESKNPSVCNVTPDDFETALVINDVARSMSPCSSLEPFMQAVDKLVIEYGSEFDTNASFARQAEAVKRQAREQAQACTLS